VKSNPVPDSGTPALAASALEEIASEPVCAPAFAGANSTPTVQFPPAASDVPHVLAVNLKPSLAVNAKLSNETVALVFEIVTVIGLLVEPTPVTGKLTRAGCIWTPPVSPPVPLRATVVAVGTEVDWIVSVPVNDPRCMGENTTPTVQFALAVRLVPHVFWTRLKGPLPTMLNPAAAIPPEFVTDTICAALAWPIDVGANVSVPGLALKAEADWPVPLSGTTAAFTPSVDEVTVRAAAAAPAVAGWNPTCAVQAAPGANVAPQVVVPIEKLAAAGPVIWNPTLANKASPAFVTVRVAGALATPTC
jgi:hypothetical protein